MKKILYIPAALGLLFLIFTHPAAVAAGCSRGLTLWYTSVLPSLLPFLILSGLLIRSGMFHSLNRIYAPVLSRIFRISEESCYAVLIGFLCGFPMGARAVGDLYARQMVTKREAEYLLAFCNNIGPVYFCSFVLPLLGRQLALPYLFGMYGIPLLYGLVLRRTLYRDLPLPKGERDAPAGLICCEAPPGMKAAPQAGPLGRRLLAETDHAIQSSVQSILSLGGYMVLYNLLNLIPHMLLGHPLQLLSPLLEITGGLRILGDSLPLYSFLALSFGGLSCIAQTYNCIGDSDLSVGSYILHKLALTGLNGIFYLCWFQISPASFLR